MLKSSSLIFIFLFAAIYEVKSQDFKSFGYELTNDVYDNGSYRFAIIRGGSYYNPTSSNWYVKDEPQPLNKTQMLLLVSPGFDRSSTVGFRCVKGYEIETMILKLAD